MRNIDFVIRKTAQELSIPEDQAKPVVMAYWDEIYKKIVSGKETTVTVRHVGSFAISRFKLNLYIRKILDKIKRFKKTDKLTSEKKEECVTEEKRKLTRALFHRNKIAINYAQIFKNI